MKNNMISTTLVILYLVVALTALLGTVTLLVYVTLDAAGRYIL